MPKTIDQLIFNSPYEEPREHWRYHCETRLFTREPERRSQRFFVAPASLPAFSESAGNYYIEFQIIPPGPKTNSGRAKPAECLSATGTSWTGKPKSRFARSAAWTSAGRNGQKMVAPRVFASVPLSAVLPGRLPERSSGDKIVKFTRGLH